MRRSHVLGRPTTIGAVGAFVVAALAYVPTSGAIRSSAAPRPMAEVARAASLPAGSVRIGREPARAPLRLDVVLAPRDPAALSAFVASVDTPGSAAFRAYLRPGQFGRRFGPTPAALRLVLSTLSALGLEHVVVSPNRMLVAIRTTVGSAERAFSTSIARVRIPVAGTAYANVTGAVLPSSIASFIEGVVGLDDVGRLAPAGLRIGIRPGRRRAGVVPRTSAAVGPHPCIDASDTGAATSITLASAYGLNGLYRAGDLGQRQTIALFEPAAYSRADVAAYQRCYRTRTRVSVVTVDGGSPIGAGTLEATSDVEDLIGIAPLARVSVYETGNSFTPDWLDAWARVVGDDTAQVVSTSWLSCEPDEPTGFAAAESVDFEQAAAQGQTVLAATGDYGSEACKQFSGSSALAVDDPASDPYVTAVGGTSWTALGPRAGERAWNSGPGSGGGGVSANWAMPAWQQGPGVVNRFSSGAPCKASPGQCREVPDVAALSGAPYYAFYCTAGDCSSIRGWGSFYGTSFATPLWAASVALADESCARPPMGFLDPTLYALAASRDDPLHDITAGGNDYTGSNGGRYPATPGYDLATGLGTPEWTTGTARLGLAGQLCLAGTVPESKRTTVLAAPANAAASPSGGMAGVSCAATTACVAVGSYVDAAGDGEPMAATGRGGTFGPAFELTAPSTAASNPAALLLGVACAAPSACTAVGGFTDTSGDGQAMVTTEAAGGWRRGLEVVAPTNAASNPAAELRGVSCLTASTCVAVGTYTTASSVVAPMAAVESGGVWGRATEVLAPPNAAPATAATLGSVSCASQGECVAVGGYTDSSGRGEAMVASETSGTWSQATGVVAPPTAIADPLASLVGVACTSTTTCVGVGSFENAPAHDEAMVVDESAGRWGRAAAVASPGGQGEATGVACTSPGTCEAVGTTGNGAGSIGLEWMQTSGRWAAGSTVRTPALSAVGCAFDHACVAVGSYGAVSPAPPTIRRLSPSAGPSGGGATVWIVGSGLSHATGVRFGTAAARMEGVASDDEIEVAAPRGTGTVAVTVTSLWGDSPATTGDRFRFVPPPAVSGVSPRVGPPSGGTVVRIVGADLVGAVSVRFGAVAGRIDRIVSASEVMATAPAGSGVVDVTVTTVGGTSSRSARDRYTY